MQLQQFVTETIEELGGVVIPVEYALCQVLIPKNYASFFQNKTELTLAFDFEVAQENPNAEFVTFGSFFLEQLLTIVHQNATCTLRFAEIERLKLGNPLKKITEFLANRQGKITILEEQPVLGVWAVFGYNVTFVADERIESVEQVWVNLQTNEIDLFMKQEQNRIVYKQTPLYTYPISGSIDILQALNAATKYVQSLVEKQKSEQSNRLILEKDVERITNYYSELLAENEKRSNRKGLSEDKVKEIKTKSEAIKLERDKQLQEIYNKYNGQIELNLDNGILYFIPILEYKIEVVFRGEAKEQKLYYNPVTKSFFSR
ncbi:MAG: hypothetical protein WAW77_04635 [Caldibacillus thermoamylovorans]|uniref:hypothetical protein n=1 Tax=Caldifermentibacillus hisashii TaxID=996558 RepID=UPI0031B6FCD7